MADKITVIRSMTHARRRTSAAHIDNMFTGYRPSPALQFPSMGSVVSHEYGPGNNLPPYARADDAEHIYAGTGYLFSAFSQFNLGADPVNKGFRVQDLDLLGGSTDHGSPPGAAPWKRSTTTSAQRRSLTTWRQWIRSTNGCTA